MRFGLGKKLVFVIVVVVVVTVVLSGIATFFVSKKVLVDLTRSQLETISVLKEGSIKKYVDDAEVEIKSFAEIEHRREHLLKFLEKNEESEKDIVVNDFFPEIVGSRLSFEDILLIDTSGAVVASSRKSDEGKIKSNEDYFIGGLEKSTVQSFFYDQAISKTTTVIATPIRDKNSKTIGVLAGRLGLGVINRLMTDRSGLGKSGETFLVNSSNVATTELLKEPGSVLKKTIFLPQIKTCLDGESNFGNNFDYKGDEVFGYWHWFPEVNSCLVTKIDKAEVFKSLYQTVYILMTVAAIITVIVGVIGYGLGISITRPIGKLRDIAIKIKEGNFDIRADIRTRDEIGDLSIAFNEMADKLSKATQNLEGQVLARTKDLEAKTVELEKTNKLMVGRELRMVELKNELQQLKNSQKYEVFKKPK